MDDIPDVFRNSYQVLLKVVVVVFFFLNYFFTHIALGFVAVLTILFGFTFYSEGLFRKVLALLVLHSYVGLVAKGFLSN